MTSAKTKQKRPLAATLSAIVMNLTAIPLIFFSTVLSILFFLPIFLSVKSITGWRADLTARKLVWTYGRIWIVVMFPFVRFKRDGFQNEDDYLPCIMVVNHQSFFDVYCLSLLPFKNVVLGIRSWPFKMFWYAPFMHLAQYINVEKLAWGEIAEKAKKLLSERAALLFFPEAHRSKDGKLQRFHTGAFKLATETGIKVLPLCIYGTHDLLPPGRWWLEPARISLRALDPVDPKMFKGPVAHRELGKYVKDKMAQCLKEMAAETRWGKSAAIP